MVFDSRKRRTIPTDIGQYVDYPTVASEAGRQAAGLPKARPGMPGQPGTLTRFPANFVPPPTALDFNASANRNFGPGPATATIATFRIPRGSIGVVRSLSFQINNMLVTTIINFSLTINEAPVPGWTYSIFPRAAANVVVSFGPEETFIKVPDGSLIGFQVTRQDAGTNLVGGLFHGWHFSKTIAAAYGMAGV